MRTHKTIYFSAFLVLVITIAGFRNSNTGNTKPEFRNFYGIAWNGDPHDNLLYAKQMRYDYVFYQKGMELDTLSNGLLFYLETPEYFVYPRRIETKKIYTAEEIRFFETQCALMNTHKPFPDNIARGWFMGPYVFTPQLDLQQQKVIDWAIDSILMFVQAIQNRNPKFRFGGFAWDVPQPAGDFWDTIQRPGRQITLKHWTGGDYGAKHPEVIHNYSTYSDGRIEFYKQLYKATRKKFSHARFIMEPYRIYDDWIQVVGHRSDAREVTPDMLVQERYGDEFATDERIFNSQLIKKEYVGSTTPDRFSDADNRMFAAKAAMNGSWFSWYGRFGGTGDMPKFRSIREIPPRLKLIRVLPNWDNLQNVPLKQRSWDGTTYKSPNSMASPDIIYSRQPNTKKIFVVFQSANGELTLSKNERISKIFETDDCFIEKNESDLLLIKNNRVTPRDSACLNKGYIFHLK